MFTNDNKFQRIDELYDVKFSIKAIVDYRFFNDLIPLAKNYSKSGLFKIKANLNISGTLLASQIIMNITEGNIFNNNCNNNNNNINNFFFI